jgi:hypothetical protein
MNPREDRLYFRCGLWMLHRPALLTLAALLLLMAGYALRAVAGTG